MKNKNLKQNILAPLCKGSRHEVTDGFFYPSKKSAYFIKIYFYNPSVILRMPPSFAQGGLKTLTPINLEKSRQTSVLIPRGIISVFNKDFANFTPLKLNLFNSHSANTRRVKYDNKL